MIVSTTGRHVLTEYRGCDPSLINDVESVEKLLKRAVIEAGAHIVQSVFHRFTPHGVSGVVVIQESHISVHTWPEAGYAAVDFYTCGDIDPRSAHPILARGFGATDAESILVHRGNLSQGMRAESIDWQAHALKRMPSRTLLPHPTHYYMVSGANEGPTELNAFDHALLAAGIGDTNLVRMSSILPPHTAEMKPASLPPGALVPVAYASMVSETPGETISAAVAVAFPEDPTLPGLIMEHHAAEPLASVSEKVKGMCVAGMKHRGRAIREVRIKGAEHVVEQIGCAFAAVVLWHDN